MHPCKIFSLIAIASIFTVAGFAHADETGAPTAPQAMTSPLGTPQRGVDAAGKCTQEFVTGYSSTGTQINSVSTYLKADQTKVPPNLSAAVLACHRFETAFAGVSCQALKADKTAVTVSTTDLSKPCDAVRSMAAQIPSINPAGPISDASPISILNPARLNAAVVGASKLQAAAAQPMLVFIINGEVLSMGDALLRDEAVRCSITRESTTTPLLIANGNVLTGSDVDEAYANGTHISQIAFSGVDLMIRCASKSDAAVTLGDLKNAFNGILSISYTP